LVQSVEEVAQDPIDDFAHEFLLGRRYVDALRLAYSIACRLEASASPQEG
jgi:hypothetical protein